MQRAAIAGLWVCCLTTAFACRDADPPPVPILEEGCVTASDGEFILTDLHPGERNEKLEHTLPDAPRPRPTPEAYLLLGADEKLRPLAGRRVKVAGEAETGHVAELRTINPMVRARPAPQEDAAPSAEATPKVGTGYQLRMEIHLLRLISVEPTGDPCF